MSPPSRRSCARLPHPHVRRASELGAAAGRCVQTGYAALSAELPGGGWPCGTLIELLLDAPGMGELQLLRPALAELAHQRRVALVQPPAMPCRDAWLSWGLDPGCLLWIQPAHADDALWCAEQVLRSGSCAALMCWLPLAPIRALRRLHGLAQAADTLFVVFRPTAAARLPSAAALRLALQPLPGGVAVHVVKRRGPPREAPIVIPLHAPAPYAPLLPAVPAVPFAPSVSLAHGTLDLPSSPAFEPGRALS